MRGPSDHEPPPPWSGWGLSSMISPDGRTPLRVSAVDPAPWLTSGLCGHSFSSSSQGATTFMLFFYSRRSSSFDDQRKSPLEQQWPSTLWAVVGGGNRGRHLLQLTGFIHRLRPSCQGPAVLQSRETGRMMCPRGDIRV